MHLDVYKRQGNTFAPEKACPDGQSRWRRDFHTKGKRRGKTVSYTHLDPVQATRAACRYLKDLYSIYHDWTLAIAAYNCSPGNVNKALARAGGGTTFWDIYEYLPRETRGYVGCV